MRSLTVARDTCERLHPGLLAAIEAAPLPERESADSKIVDLLRRHSAAGLLVPEEFGGTAASALDAARVLRAIASASPSLGVAATMHHFTVAMLFSLAGTAERLNPAQLKLLSGVAGDGVLLASGWAEGRTEQNILIPAVTAEPVDDGYRVNGSKKPCSLSRSMNVLTASVALNEPGRPASLAVLLIPADSPGISVRPFWSSPILAAAQSHEVILEDVAVPAEMVIRSTPEDAQRLDDLQTGGFAWFELLVTSTYTGVASALVDKVLERGRGHLSDRANLALKLHAAIGLVEGAARAIDDGLDGEEAVATVLVARYAAQELLSAAVDAAVELLGGMSFIGSPDVTYLASAVRALAFHPPSRTSAVEALVDYFGGAPLQLS